MVDQARARRLAKRITQIVADALEHEVKDPRLAMVTITDTRVTGDLREATVYYTVLGETIDSAPDSAGAAAALASATGVLRTLVGAGTGVRHTPSLQFVPDVVPDEARRMEELLARTRESDAAVARLAADARPAGEADPYRDPPSVRGRREPERRRGVNPDPLSTAAGLLLQAREVTLLAHVQPDADSLGSALALAIALHRRGTAVQVSFATPEGMPETLRMLDVYGLVVPPARIPAAPEVLVACDAAEPARLGALADRLDTARHTIMIDHHVSNPGFGELQLLDPAAEATVVIVRRLLAAMGVPLDADVARCIYAGLVTDTSNFISAGAAAHRLAAELVEAGVDAERLVRSLMYTHPHAWLAALGRTLGRAVLEPEAAGGLGLVHTTCPAPTSTGSAPRTWTAWSTWCAPPPRPRWRPCSSRSPRPAGSSRCAPTAGSTWPRWPSGSAAAGIPARPASPGRAPRASCCPRCAPRWLPRRPAPRQRRSPVTARDRRSRCTRRSTA